MLQSAAGAFTFGAEGEDEEVPGTPEEQTEHSPIPSPQGAHPAASPTAPSTTASLTTLPTAAAVFPRTHQSYSLKRAKTDAALAKSISAIETRDIFSSPAFLAMKEQEIQDRREQRQHEVLMNQQRIEAETRRAEQHQMQFMTLLAALLGKRTEKIVA
jgi:hypothetical protein